MNLPSDATSPDPSVPRPDVPDVPVAAETADPAPSPSSAQPRDAVYWAREGSRLHAANPTGALNNVEGLSAVSPLQGFGQMWQKTYRVWLVKAEATPQDVISTWKANFQSFWPKGNRFYAPLTGIQPGEVALLRVKAGGMPLSTGVLVLYADNESFTLMTPQGHMFAGWITFSSFVENETTVAQAQVLMRANDPIYELGMRLGGNRQEDRFWQHTLGAVARYFGVTSEVITEAVCVDPRLQWARVGNIWHNAAMRTAFAMPGRLFRREREQPPHPSP